jgi:porin
VKTICFSFFLMAFVLFLHAIARAEHLTDLACDRVPKELAPSACYCRTCDSVSPQGIGPWLNRDSGISFEPVYYGEVFSNARGGISTKNATQYQALLDLSVGLDFQTVGLPLPGRFVLLAQNTHGRGLSQDFIGDFQTISNIDSFDNIMQVSEYWWEVPLPESNGMVRLGKQDVNTEFLLIDLAQDFIHSSFGLTPTAGLPSYPDPSMAAVVLCDLTQCVRLKAGLWDLLADGGGWGFSGNDVTLAIAELGYQYTLIEGALPGAIDLGIVYASGGMALDLSIPSVVSYYVQFEQLVYRENPCDEDDSQGLGVFASYAPRFPSRPIPITAISEDVVGGIVYRGLVPGRDTDVVGVGAAWARLNQGGSMEETAIEFFYKCQITPSMSIQPDIQYVGSPSGIYRDALAVGLRFQLAL